MTELNQVLSVERTQTGAPGNSKKKVLEHISQALHEVEPTLSAEQVFSSLTERERLGSTGFGNGVAIPHCRMSECQTPIGLLIRLSEPVDFDAMDQKKVDLLFTLVVPQEANNEHLQLLSRIAERFGDDQRLKAMRSATDGKSVYDAFLQD